MLEDCGIKPCICPAQLMFLQNVSFSTLWIVGLGLGRKMAVANCMKSHRVMVTWHGPAAVTASSCLYIYGDGMPFLSLLSSSQFPHGTIVACYFDIDSIFAVPFQSCS